MLLMSVVSVAHDETKTLDVHWAYLRLPQVQDSLKGKERCRDGPEEGAVSSTLVMKWSFQILTSGE